MSLFLLQAEVQYFKEADPLSGIIFLVGVGAIILIVIVSSIIKNGLGAGKGLSKGSSTHRHFSFFTFHRICRIFGLNSVQSKTLEQVLKNNSVVDLDRAVNDPVNLDKHFKVSYKLIEKNTPSDEEMNKKLTMLFSTRNAIEIYHNTSSGASSAPQLAAGMEAVLSANEKSYPTKIISTQPNTVLIECPTTPLGTQIRFSRGVKARLAFFTKSNKSFLLESQVLDVQNTSFGPALLLSRSRSYKAMTQRRYRRKQVELTCGIYHVYVEQTKRKAPPKLTVDKRRMLGSIIDISIGGCGIKTKNPVSAGSRLKIEFETGDSGLPLAMLGQVLRINRTGINHSIVHVKFLKIPRKTMNTINALVFDYL